MKRETISLTVDELLDIICGGSDIYDLISTEITGTFRHGNENNAVIKRLSDGKFFSINYRDSVKESCDFEDLNHDDTYTEVFPVEKTITVYE